MPVSNKIMTVSGYTAGGDMSSYIKNVRIRSDFMSYIKAGRCGS